MVFADTSSWSASSRGVVVMAAIVSSHQGRARGTASGIFTLTRQSGRISLEPGRFSVRSGGIDEGVIRARSGPSPCMRRDLYFASLSPPHKNPGRFCGDEAR